MAYIGNTQNNQNYVPAVDYFNGNGSTTAFTLSRPVASVAAVQAVINNVPQNPGDAFTVSGSTITFTSAPPSGTNNIYVYYTSPNTQVVQPGQGTVGTTQLQSDLTLTNPTYTGTLTGGTGVVNIGSGQVYKDSSGNVGMGTSSPTDNGSYGKALDVNGTTGAAIYARTNGSSTQYALIGSYGADGYVANRATGNLIFQNNNAERMRIDSSGNLLVGETSNNGGGKVDVTGLVKASQNGSGYSAAGHEFVTANANSYDMIIGNNNATPLSEYMMSLRFKSAAPNNSSARFIEGLDTSATRFYFRSDGGLSNYQANNTNLSDRNEKTDFAPAKTYLDAICSIPVQTFKYIGQTDDEPTLGVVAQDVQKVAPELVCESNWGSEEEPKMRLSIYQTDLQYALMKAIQELNAKVEAQAAEIAALKGAA